ncbi:hypothetical protein K431DRAFT_285072 [Polychaeton citri CBS 116435]|uniref:PHD-type domain-containing protein n=1 Tax=Polychaeton citri CBS 116435 TaxID=1314669 RepID=A0A9P4Q846_9PEZI|nr:hypothetical protein K431DRAFT_285072 [Polychaeton citri CBS 116435]
MSFLSSLLNPTPQHAAGEEQQHQQQQRQQSSSASPTLSRKDSLPPIQHVQSPDEPRQHLSSSPSQQNAGSALPPLSTVTSASGDEQQLPHGTLHEGIDGGYDHGRRPSEIRPGSSGYSAQMELPPPIGGLQRKASSPTLEQYHHPSRSPEQRKATAIISPSQQSAGVSLPPLQGLHGHAQDADGEQPVLQRSNGSHESSHVSASHAESSFATPAQQDRLGSDVQPTTVMKRQSPPHPLPLAIIDNHPASPDGTAAEVIVKQEDRAPSQDLLHNEDRRLSMQSDREQHGLKPVASLKSETSLRNPSPLRDSSVPMPSTEKSPPSEQPLSKKRSAPTKKKGTAAITKKAPPIKKRKTEPKRGVKAVASSKTTPLNSSPAPSGRSSVDPGSEPFIDDEDEDSGPAGSDEDLYCICRKPDNGTFMIGCDGDCDDWFHGKCVGVEERNKHLIDKYICPSCTEAGIGRTTWKRMCRRIGCRQPARVAGVKSGKDVSKYCSEECGLLYFKEMVARTRGKEETGRLRRKSSFGHHKAEDGPGARGGVLSAGELKALADSSKSAGEFKHLGEGMLSPPATPDGKPSSHDKVEYSNFEQDMMDSIKTQKEHARERHQLLKDRMKFVNMVKQAATHTAAERELKPKEYCGYDPRLEWTEAQFKRWRDSPTGRQAFEQDTLLTTLVKTNGNGDAMEIDTDEDVDSFSVEACDRKKCARHHDWTKLMVDDLRAEMGDNGDKMRALEKDEKETREKAILRGKLGAGALEGEGSIEIHKGSMKENIDAGPLDTADAVIKSVEAENATGESVSELMVIDATA